MLHPIALPKDRLESDPRTTYLSSMPLRLLRQIFSVFLMVAYVSATIVMAAPMAQAAPQEMSGITMTAGDTMPCHKTMKPRCVTELGCVFMVSLPAENPNVATVIGRSTVTYAVVAEFPPENSIEPALGPPIFRA